MNLLNPHHFRARHSDTQTEEFLQGIIAWFEDRGLPRLKQDWHDRVWNHDFVEFMRQHQALASTYLKNKLRCFGRC